MMEGSSRRGSIFILAAAATCCLAFQPPRPPLNGGFVGGAAKSRRVVGSFLHHHHHHRPLPSLVRLWAAEDDDQQQQQQEYDDGGSSSTFVGGREVDQEEADRRERFRVMQEEVSHMWESRATKLAREAQRLREEVSRQEQEVLQAAAARRQQQQQQQHGSGGGGSAPAPSPMMSSSSVVATAASTTSSTSGGARVEDELADTNNSQGEEGASSSTLSQLVLETEWIPPQLRQALACCSDDVVSEEDVLALRREVFGLDTFWVTGEERRVWPRAVLFHGNLRGVGLEETMEVIEHRLRHAPHGLCNRVSLFLLDDETTASLPTNNANGNANGNANKVEGGEPTLAFLAVPASLSPDAAPPLGPAVAGGCLVASLVSTFAFIYSSFAANPDFFDKYVAMLDVGGVSSTVLPVAGGIMALQAVHEVAHRAVARRWRLKLGLPFFLPSLELGIFGAITPLQSFPLNRKALFDVALAGPLVALLLSLALFMAGLVLTPVTFADPSDAEVLSGAAEVLGDITMSTPLTAGFPVVPVSLIHQSYLLSSLAHSLVPHLSLLTSPTDVMALHPLALVGLCGILTNAFNCMPVGRLDGGRAFTSAFGRAMAQRVAGMVLVGQALLCAVSFSGLPLLFVWGMLFNTLQRRIDAPPMDDLSEVGEGRQVVLIATLFLVFLALMPWTPSS